MSFFKKIFGGGSFEDHRAEADRLFDAGAFEDARIAFERALEKSKGAPTPGVTHCQDRVAQCLDRMAEARIEQATALVRSGHLDLAEVELRNAMETAASEDVARRARRALETLERDDARKQADAEPEMSDDDRWALLAGSWENEQLDEYDEYDESFRAAVLMLHEGRGAEARSTLEGLLAATEEPRYLLLEVARARILTEDYGGGEEALRAFLRALDDDEGGDARLSAYAELAGLRDREDDEEGAIGELENAMEAFPDDPRPFFMMGRYLRTREHPEEAIDVLEAALPLLDEGRPDWRFFEELGLARVAAGQDEAAAEDLDRVIALFVQLRSLDFPPATAVARAKLHEKAGELEKAADLYRGLARGSDRENHLGYHREVARLLVELGLDGEARRMLTRALALAEGDAEALAEVEAKLAELE